MPSKLGWGRHPKNGHSIMAAIKAAHMALFDLVQDAPLISMCSAIYLSPYMSPYMSRGQNSL